MFEPPPRLLEKYKYFPSGDQTGLRSVKDPSVTATASPPLIGMVHMCSRCPYRLDLLQYAMRFWLGETVGCSASPSERRCLSPVLKLIFQSWLLVGRVEGCGIFSVPTRM